MQPSQFEVHHSIDDKIVGENKIFVTFEKFQDVAQNLRTIPDYSGMLKSHCSRTS